MGQYHVLANLDKKEYVHPDEVEDGMKMWEWNNTLRAMQLLLCPSAGLGGGDIEDETGELTGRWVGDRVVVLGDYVDQALAGKAFKNRDEWLKWIRAGHEWVRKIDAKTRKDILKVHAALLTNGPRAEAFYQSFRKRTEKRQKMLGLSVMSIPEMPSVVQARYGSLKAAWKTSQGWTDISPLIMRNAKGFEIKVPRRSEGENPGSHASARVGKWLVVGVLQDRQGRSRDYEQMFSATSHEDAVQQAVAHSNRIIKNEYDPGQGIELRVTTVRRWTEGDEREYLHGGRERIRRVRELKSHGNPPSWIDMEKP